MIDTVYIIVSWCLKNKEVIILGAIGSIIASIFIAMYKATIHRILRKMLRASTGILHRCFKTNQCPSISSINSDNSKSTKGINRDSFPVVPYPTTTFFHYRLTDAFPCLNDGLTEFKDRRTIIKRMELLLAEPLTFSSEDSRPGFDSHPIWWFRGTYNLWIDNFQVINRHKVLINIDEYIVTKLIVYKSKHNYRDFLYVECAPDKPSGAYQYTKESIEREVNEYGFCQEEFGLHNKRIISRKEYDEGSTLIRGNPTSTSGAKLRSRVLTKYNFIIAAKHSPYNSNAFDFYSEEYFNRLLNNQIEFDEFLVWMQSLNRNPRDMESD